MLKNPKTRFLGEMHAIAADLYAGGLIDKQTMREYDRDCLIADTPAYKVDHTHDELRPRLTHTPHKVACGEGAAQV